MRLHHICLLFLAACASGPVKSDGTDDGSGEGNFEQDTGEVDDTGQDDDTGDTGDTGEPEPSIEDWEGDWLGALAVYSVGDDQYGWDDCEGSLELDFDDDGEVDGDGVCVGLESDWGDPESYEVEFEGAVDAEGVVTGLLVVEAGSWGDVEMQIDTQATEDGIEGGGNGEVVWDAWGTEYTLSLQAEFELERE